jgi:tRNA uridine 5-carbamoylmethylation protein Kti12
MLVLIRGLPGSGKSTLAKIHFRNWLHYEADMFFIESDGEYRFDGSRIGAAHQWCQNQTESALALGMNVAVSNTFTTVKELMPYIDMASKYNHSVVIFQVNGNWGNVHNVPADSIQRMKNRFIPNSQLKNMDCFKNCEFYECVGGIPSNIKRGTD